jgi:hypothetical protein
VGKTYNQLDERLHSWIAAQHSFFVATAPKRPGGHVNLSPKGHADTCAVLDERTVTYLDLTGRGAETAAHLGDDGRITLMFCAISGLPRILRLYGQGRIVLPSEQRWDELAACFRPAAAPVTLLWSRSSASRTPAATRSRSTTTPETAALFDQWAVRKDEAAMAAYRAQRNGRSIDGLSALPMPASDRQAGPG